MWWTVFRYNYLVGEIDATYHELSTKFGLSDSMMRILYTICDCCAVDTVDSGTAGAAFV